jgi:cysteine-rich repeat protein
MRKLIVLAATMAVGAGASAVGATSVPDPFYGSDTLGVVTPTAITNAGISSASFYIPGGSGAGQNAMSTSTLAKASQLTAPMSKMMTNGICTAFGTTSGASGNTAATSANGIVIGMDAITLYSSSLAGGTPACNGGVDPLPGPDASYPDAQAPGFGAVYSGTTGVFGATYTNDAGATTSPAANSAQNWKWALALLYGGLDYTQPLGTVPDCNSAARQNLVKNWGNLFQATQTAGNSCSNSGVYAGVCSDSTHNNVLWHAFRRDDVSGTSDIFSNVLGLQLLWGSIGESSNHGFGISPYCNALNWDANTSNNGGTSCNNGPDDQFVGPGGIVDPNSQCTFTSSVNFGAGVLHSGSPAVGPSTAETCGANGAGNHRMPPPGVWGTNPVPNTANAANFDVLPTYMQDNDPIRRPCIGNTVGSVYSSAEEVCNLDGKLGLVIPVPASDFITNPAEQTLYSNPSSAVQFPTATCSAFVTAPAPGVFNCAPFSAGLHTGECPNGDTTFGGDCIVPATGTSTSSTSQCLAGKSTATQFHVRNIGSPDGRAFNLHMFNGVISSAASTGYINWYALNGTTIGASGGPTKLPFVGGYSRIHSIATIYEAQTISNPSGLAEPPNVGCQQPDATDQIACLTQADPCSVGYAGAGGKTWNESIPAIVCQTIQNQFNAAGDPSPLPPACAGGAAGLLSDAMRIDTIYATPTTVTALGTAALGTTGAATGSVEYPIGRKLYFNSIVGFANVNADQPSTLDNGVGGEINLAEYESNGPSIESVLDPIGYFPLAFSSQAAALQKPFCEDFNEQMLCGASSNRNACPDNASIPAPTGTGLSPIPSTAGSICGNGVVEAYEECDDGTSNGVATDKCSNICRCANGFSFEPDPSSPGNYLCQ